MSLGARGTGLVASVVIPARDAETSVGAAVRAVSGQTDAAGNPVEVVVVDDGSRDATARVASEAGARVISAAGDGPARARNMGVAEATSPLIVFTDADCRPLPGFIAEILAPFADPSVAGVKGAYVTEQRSLTARFVQIEYEERYRRMLRRPQIDFIDTYAAAYRREVLERVGGFDERYRLPSTEDQELSFRVAATGARLVFSPAARVAHLHADSLWAYARKKAKIGRFKVATLRQHPSKAVDDAHTPVSLKLQLVLLPFLLGGGIAYAGDLAGLWPFAGAVVLLGVLLGLFLLTTLSLWGHALLRDPLVGLLFPLFVLVRATALGCGVLQGCLHELRGGVLPAPAPSIQETDDSRLPG